MADRIKGITIEFRGNATPLQKAIREVDSALSKTTEELSSVNKALKFNPTSVELWRQKQQLLTQKVNETKTKLDALKQAQNQMDASGVDKNSEEYRKLQRQIIETGSQLKTFQSQLREVGNANLKALSEQFKQAGTAIDGAGQSLRGVSMAAAGVVAGLGAISVKAGIAADDLNTLSKVTGIGTQDLQKYSYAADLVDVSTEAIAKSNKRLVKSAYDAANGSKTQAAAFDAIGVAVTDANGNLRDSESIFQDVLTALGQMTNETERDAIAQQLMGRSAAQLNPLIEDGGETYRKVAETMQKYGLDYVDQETLDKANEFNDSLDTMKLLGSVAFAQVGSELAGHLAPALEKAVDLVGRFANWLSKLSPETLTVIGTIAGLVAILAPLLMGIGKVAFAISSIINVVSMASGAFAAIGGVIGGVAAGPILAIIAAIGAVIAIFVVWKKHGDEIKTFFINFGKKIAEVWTNLKTAVVNKITEIKNGITNAFTAIKNFISTMANAWFDAMTWPYRKAWEIIKGIIEKIKNFFPIKIGDFFGKIKLPHFKLEGSFSLNPPSVPKLKIDWYDKGGIFKSPSIIGVGEKRPEFVGALDDLRTIVREESGGGIGGGVVINVYATPGMNEEELARKIEQKLVAMQKQRNMAYGNI